MSEFQIEVEGGSTVRLPTGGKYCDRDILVTATGGSDEFPLDRYFERESEEIILPNALKIGDNAFYYYLTILKKVSAPKAESIGKNAFYQCQTLEEIDFPNVTSIGQSAFQRCLVLSITSLPPNLTNIGYRAFYECPKLAITSIPNGLTIIANEAFYSTGVTKMTFHKDLVQIGQYAFERCFSLKEVIFEGRPSGYVHSFAFSGCSNLTSIKVPWPEGTLSGAPWGATNAVITYNYTGEEG